MSTDLRKKIDCLTENEQQAVSEFVDHLERQFAGQVTFILLFGSRARGEAQPDSDLDIVVVMSDVGSKTRKAVRYLAVEVWLKYGMYLSTRVWNQAHWHELEELQTLFYRNICRDGIAL
jgi:predicted nucleotidyltransferase